MRAVDLFLHKSDARDRFAFEHGFHADAWKRKLLEEEINTARVVAVVTLKYSKEAYALRTEVRSLHNVTPQKAGCEAFDFVALAGKVTCPWALFIFRRTKSRRVRVSV